MLRPAQHRLVVLTTAFALSLLSCGREVTGPENGISFGRRVASIALAPQMPSVMRVVQGAGNAVPFTRVRVVLRNEDGSVAKDTLVNFPSDADSVSLALSLVIPSSAPTTGLPLALTMAYVNAAGDTVFRAGPSPVTARPAGSPGANDPIVIPVTYDGPGKDAVAVVIAPDTGTRVAGTSQAFTATALDAQSQAIANTPFVFFTLDSTRVQVGGATGVATWLPVRGTARIVAALPNGLRADTATFTVALPASQLVLASGGAQTAAVGTALTDSVVVRTLASDGEPAQGVVVTFAVASGGGALSATADTTDVNGRASTRWTLGTTLGAQAITAAAGGLSGSPLAIAATGIASTPSQLVIASQPSAAIAGVTMAPAIVVEVRDAFGNVATTFTGDVSVALAGTTLPTVGGTLTRAAVKGVATFPDLALTAVGTYKLVFTSPALTPDTTTAISITPAVAASLEFVTQPAGGTAGAAITPPVTVRALDAFGNVVTGFTNSVSLALLDSGSAVLSGSAQQNAVSGVATFSALAVNLVGSTYRLVANSTALTPDTSAAFSITAAAPSALVLTAQPAEPRVSGAPFTVSVSTVDAFGNVSNSSTALATVSIASGPSGAVLSGVTSRALVAGATSFPDLALNLAGSYQLAIAAPGLTGVTTGSITVTAGAAATVTVISGDAQSGVVNTSLATPLVVAVRDAAGNIVQGASVAWTVTSATGTAALSSATSVTDTSGRASTSVTLGNTVGAVTVTATVGTLPAVTFTATSVAGAASELSVVSGTNQQDFATQTLSAPVILRVRDAFNNVRVGDSVFVSVTVGGGTLGNGMAADTLLSDTQGAVSVTWKLGATAGTQSIQARTATLAPVTISAVALQSVANAIWTGSVSSNVTDTGNWRNAIVPSATDSVLIPAGRPNYPVLATSVTYSRFTLEDAATFNLASSNLIVTGRIRAPLDSGIIASQGLVIGKASAGVVSGKFPNLRIQGNYQPLGLVNVMGDLTISGSASFNVVTGDSLHVGGNLITQADGTFSQSGNSGISVFGDLSLDGGTSLFGAGGRLHLFGNLSTGPSAAATAFLADSAHTVILRSGSTQTITFAAADSIPGGVCEASCLGILSANKGVNQGGVIFASTVMAQGGLQIEVESITATGQYVISGAPATIRGASGGVFRRFGFTGSYVASAFSTDTLVAFGSGVLPASLSFPTIVAGQYSITDTHSGSLVVTGSLDVDGVNAQVAGSLITRGSGRLTMTDATDSLLVGGDLRFAGSGSAGQLTAGVLRAMADVSIDAASAVRADSAHVLWMSGATPKLNVADSTNNRLGSLRLSGNTNAGFSGVAAKFSGDVVLNNGASFLVSETQPMEIAGRLVDPAGSSFSARTILTGTNAIGTPVFGGGRLILRGSNALSANFTAMGDVWIESGGNLAPNTWSVDITDSLITSGTGIITMNSPEDTMTVRRDAVFNGGASVLTAGYLRVQSRFAVGSQQGFQGQPGHTTEFFELNNQQLSFSHPGFGPSQSHFGRVLLNKSDGSPTSSTAIFVNGQFVTANSAQAWAGAGQSTPLTIRGSDIAGLSLSNQPLTIVDGAYISNLSGLFFTGFTQAGTTQLRVERSGGTVRLDYPTFDSTAAEPTTYIFADDVANDASILTIEVVFPRPMGHNNRIGTDGTAQITGWNASALREWQGSLGSDRSNVAHWVNGAVPTVMDSMVVMSTGLTPWTLRSPIRRSRQYQRGVW